MRARYREEAALNHYNGFTPYQRTKAYRWLKREYADGRRSPPTSCDGCGQTEGIIEAHSEDYSEPYGDHIGQFGFCYRCHMMLHNRIRAPEVWTRYKAEVAAGVTFTPFLVRDWWSFRAQHLTGRRPAVGEPGPARHDMLSQIG
jgi:hypothetical protein